MTHEQNSETDPDLAPSYIQETSSLDVIFKPREDLIDILTTLSFTREAAVRALYNTGNSDADFAATWILEHIDDLNLNSPLSLDEAELDSEDEFVSSDKMYKMVFVINSQLGMGVGKVAAQVGHAAIGLHRRLLNKGQAQLFIWEKLGETKVVVKGESAEQLKELSDLASSLNLHNYSVHDAGHTQVAAGSLTVLGVFGPVDAVNQVTGQLKLL